MMYLALSYDHRIVDGKEAVTFLVRVKEALEDPGAARARSLRPFGHARAPPGPFVISDASRGGPPARAAG